MQYIVKLNKDVQIVTEGQWPQTVIGDGIEINADSAAIAVHEVSDQYGVSAHCLIAVPK